MEHEGLIFRPKQEEPTGELPRNCRSVLLQYWDRDLKDWTPKNPAKSCVPYPRTQMVVEMTKAMQKGPWHYEAYRLIPSNIEFDASEDSTEEGTTLEKTKKVAKKKTEQAPKEKAELVAGIFRAGSFKAQIYDAMKDGKTHSLEELEKVCKGCKALVTRIKVVGMNGEKNKKFVIAGSAKLGFKLAHFKGGERPADPTPKQPAAAAPEKPEGKKTEGKKDGKKPEGKKTAEKPAAKKKSAAAGAGSSPAAEAPATPGVTVSD